MNKVRKRRIGRPPELMSQEEMRSTLVRTIILEYNNAKLKPFPRWGWEKPESLLVLRRKRLRLAQHFAGKYAAVSPLLLARRLPVGKDWPGTGALVSTQMFRWVDGQWTHVGCTLPFNHFVKPMRLRARRHG
jgi:hypothetical protein